MNDGRASLVAVCDVLVVKALEVVGKRIVRMDRSRHERLHRERRALHEAHTLWPADEEAVVKALRGAWDVVPVILTTYGCCDLRPADVTEALDCYVRDLVITGTSHSAADLRYRLDRIKTREESYA